MKSAPLTPELYDYVITHSSNPKDSVLEALTAETRQLGDIAEMQIAPDQMNLLTLLVAALGVRHAIEIGTFTGTSSICIARGLPADGRLLCLDINDTWTGIARRYWEKAGVTDKIELRLGDARELVKELGDATFDFAFIDADKSGYDAYYEALLPKMKPNGVFIFDNMLRHGRVLHPESEDDQAIVALNKKLAQDDRVECVLLPLADGLMIARKK